jgi:hypothetical protein
MSARRPVLTPDHPAPGAAAHRQAGYPFSLAGTTPSDRPPPVAGVVIWLAACGGAARLIATPARSGRATAASLGPATGLLSDGDVSAQLADHGGAVADRAGHAHRDLRRRDQRAAVRVPALFELKTTRARWPPSQNVSVAP